MWWLAYSQEFGLTTGPILDGSNLRLDTFSLEWHKFVSRRQRPHFREEWTHPIPLAPTPVSPWMYFCQMARACLSGVWTFQDRGYLGNVGQLEHSSNCDRSGFCYVQVTMLHGHQELLGRVRWGTPCLGRKGRQAEAILSRLAGVREWGITIVHWSLGA